MIWFAANVLMRPLDPWQQWLVIHAGELLPDGRPRFRRVLVLVARQNGKTHLCTVLALFWLFVERWPLVFGTSTNLEQAQDSWNDAVEVAKDTEALARHLPRNAVRLANGQQTFRTTHRTVYKIGATNKKGGRGKRIDRMVGDELREHRNWDGYNAAYKAMTARPRGQAVFITNQGDAGSVVLNALRTEALRFTGWWDEQVDQHDDIRADLLAGDPATLAESGPPADWRLGIFEWSAPPGSHPMDVHAWAAANPALGRRVDYDTIRSDAVAVSKPGVDPEELTGFLTETLCMSVPVLDPAIDAAAWLRSKEPGTLDAVRGRLAGCVDVAPDLQHASLVVAGALPEGPTRVEVVASWSGPDAVEQLRRDLPDWTARLKLQTLGWFPAGPAAALDADLRDRRKDGRRAWPPRGTTVAALANVEASAVTMGFAEQVGSGRVLHSGQPLLDQQVAGVEKLRTGERWVFHRRGAGHCDAVYAAAGAVHLARTMPVRRKATRAHHVPV